MAQTLDFTVNTVSEPSTLAVAELVGLGFAGCIAISDVKFDLKLTGFATHRGVGKPVPFLFFVFPEKVGRVTTNALLEKTF